MFVKLPTCESTFEKRSGRSQAAVKAQIPPELMPQIARPAASSRSFTCFADLGQDFLLQEAARIDRDGVSYSKLRLERRHPLAALARE